MNYMSILLILAVVAGFVAAVRYARRKGNCSCGGNCPGCAAKCGRKKHDVTEQK